MNSVELARLVVQLGFSDDDIRRINELSAKASAGNLTFDEDEELNNYLRVGHFISMSKSKARAAIKRSGRD